MDTSNKKLLIVEDDFFMRDLYELNAKLLKLDYATAVDGEEAIEKIRSLQPKIVLLDLMIPKLDGLNVLRTIKADPSCAAIQFIVVTNLDNKETETEARSLGAIDYLLKINNAPQKTLAMVQSLLNS